MAPFMPLVPLFRRYADMRATVLLDGELSVAARLRRLDALADDYVWIPWRRSNVGGAHARAAVDVRMDGSIEMLDATRGG